MHFNVNIKRHLQAFAGVRFFVFLIFITSFRTLQAQIDTLFWFAAPDLVASHQEIPIRFCITTYDSPATVTIEQPASNSFTPVVISMPADSFYVYDISNIVADVENTPPNTVLNRGFRISSSNNISCYYESVGNNSEVYTLKGTNAMGTDFLVPMQSQLSSYSGHNARSSIEIVATEDSTVIKVVAPVALLDGYAAGDTVTIILNRGQSYAVQAAGYGASEHLGGTVVKSNKPIVINSSDDSVDSGQGCIDLLGDQLVPIEMLGRYYVAIRNNSGFERVFVFPTESNTWVTFNGGTPRMVSVGGIINYSLVDTATLIVADKPVAVWQMTATGCEVGGTMLPHMECTGSFNVSHLRPDIERMIITIVVGTPYVSYFTINGDSTIITSADFHPMAEDSSLSYCVKNISEYVPMGSVMNIRNSVSRFQVGILDGDNSGSCSYGFYSDYAMAAATDTTMVEICFNDSYNFYGVDYSSPGTYYHNVSLLGPVCDSIHMLVLSTINDIWSDTVATVCDSVEWRGTVYDTTGIYFSDSVGISITGCDSIRRLLLTVGYHQETSDTIVFCQSQSFVYDGVDYGGPTVFDTLLTSFLGCDSLVHVVLMARDTSFHLRPLYHTTADSTWLLLDTIVLGCAPETLYFLDTTQAAISHQWTLTHNDTTLAYTDTAVVFTLTDTTFNASIQLVTMSKLGCEDTLSQPIYIFRRPIAEFDWNPVVPAIDKPEVTFHNTTWPHRDSVLACLNYQQPNISYLWYIPRMPGTSDFDTSSAFEPFYHWGQEGDNMQGDYEVQLIAYWLQYADDTTIHHVCIDSTTRTITITTDFLQFPNLVTPNGDGINDTWRVVNLLEYGNYPINELWVYNQWGEMVYHVRNINREADFWDPKATSSPDGTYYYRFTARGPYGLVKRNGVIEVIGN